MKHKLKTLVILTALLFGSVSVSYSQDYDKGLEAYNRGDYTEAFRILKPFAEKGDSVAQYSLGYIYANGDGVPQDYKSAVKWFRLAAEQGDSDAQSNLGHMYQYGIGVPQDYVLAHMWYNISASNGFTSERNFRDIIAGKMTSEQIAKAQQMARECQLKDYKDCHR